MSDIKDAPTLFLAKNAKSGSGNEYWWTRIGFSKLLIFKTKAGDLQCKVVAWEERGDGESKGGEASTPF